MGIPWTPQECETYVCMTACCRFQFCIDSACFESHIDHCLIHILCSPLTCCRYPLPCCRYPLPCCRYHVTRRYFLKQCCTGHPDTVSYGPSSPLHMKPNTSPTLSTCPISCNQLNRNKNIILISKVYPYYLPQNKLYRHWHQYLLNIHGCRKRRLIFKVDTCGVIINKPYWKKSLLMVNGLNFFKLFGRRKTKLSRIVHNTDHTYTRGHTTMFLTCCSISDSHNACAWLV